jgi:hypothetical protein
MVLVDQHIVKFTGWWIDFLVVSTGVNSCFDLLNFHDVIVVLTWHNIYMGKKKFIELIKKASQPVQPEAEKSTASGSYTEKQTHPRKNSNSKG